MFLFIDYKHLLSNSGEVRKKLQKSEKYLLFLRFGAAFLRKKRSHIE